MKMKSVHPIIGIPEFTEKYDPKDNDNIKAAIFLVSLAVLFLLIVFYLYMDNIRV